MSSFVPVRIVLIAAFVSLAWSAGAQPAMPPEEMPEAGPPPNYECAEEKVTGSGPGFASSRDESEEAAIEAWHEKAKAIYPDATWETAAESNLACAVQGLYSKCFADGIPCHPKDGAGAEASDEDPMENAEGE